MALEGTKNIYVHFLFEISKPHILGQCMNHLFHILGITYCGIIFGKITCTWFQAGDYIFLLLVSLGHNGSNELCWNEHRKYCVMKSNIHNIDWNIYWFVWINGQYDFLIYFYWWSEFYGSEVSPHIIIV